MLGLEEGELKKKVLEYEELFLDQVNGNEI